MFTHALGALGVIDLWTYVVGAAFIIVLPGPNSMYVLAVAARRGVRHGYRAACGVFLGDAILITLTAAGAASLLRANPALFSAVKYLGAAYLLYLGVTMLRGAMKRARLHTARQNERQDAAQERAVCTAQATNASSAGSAGSMTSAGSAASATSNATSAKDEAHPFRKSLAISLLNPKAILFLLSFFVQFVDPAYAHHALSFFVLGAILQFFSFIYLSTLIFSGARLAEQFRRSRKVSAGAMGVVGGLFISFSVKLALATVA